MVTLGAARRVKVLAHVVPVLVSLMLLLVFGAVLPGLPGLLLALGLAFTVPLALTRTGERATVRVFLRARAPTLVDRVALTPVAQVLHEHGVYTDRLTLLVTAGPEVDAYGVGRHTVLVTTGLVDALGSRRVSAAQGAAVIARARRPGRRPGQGRCCPGGGVDSVAGLVAVRRRHRRGFRRDHRCARSLPGPDLAHGGRVLVVGL